MDRSDASALADLQMHWDEAYVIGLDGDIWLARFRDSTDELRAHSSTQLRELIRADYSYRAKVQPDDDDLGEEDASYADMTERDASEEDTSDGGEASDGHVTERDVRDEHVSEQGEDGTRPQQPADVSLAAIRGERMST